MDKLGEKIKIVYELIVITLKQFISAKIVVLITAVVGTLFLVWLFDRNVWLHVLHDELSIDWSEPQEKAAITLSDPQVYSREALINDRRQEADFLRDLLDQSGREEFAPLKVMTTELASLVRGSLAIPPATQGGADNSPSVTSPITGSMPSASFAPPNPATTNSRLPQANATPLAPQPADEKKEKIILSNGHPQERFEDLKAYRDSIRAAIASVNLDDLHDYNGLALYRMQFYATVFPGRIKNKYGMAMLKVKSPELDEYYERIYLAWLGHVAGLINLNTNATNDIRFDVIRTSPLMSIYTHDNCQGLPAMSSMSQQCWPLQIPLPPDLYPDVDKLFKDSSFDPKQIVGSHESSCEPELYERAMNYKRTFKYILPSLVPPPVTQSVVGIGKFIFYLKGAQEEIRSVILRVEQFVGSPSCRDLALTLKENSKADQNISRVPVEFQDALRIGLEKNRPLVYKVSPAELPQRIASATKRNSSLELASQILGKADATASLRSQSNVSVLGKSPLVVGFVDHDFASGDGRAQCDKAKAKACYPVFGWVFGPRLDNQAGEFEQVLSSYALSVDIAIPGWWPYVDLELQTAWVGNWHDTTSFLETPSSPRDIRVNLPLLTPPDLESLTSRLVTDQYGPWGQHRPAYTIESVSPDSVSACSKTVTFVIRGSNLWRDAEVYWAGQKGKAITVLPNMEGITATFDIDELFKVSSDSSAQQRSHQNPLIVVARNLRDPVQVPIKLIGTRRVGKDCEGPIIAESRMRSTNPDMQGPPGILSVSPKQIMACNADLTFLISGEGFVPPARLPSKPLPPPIPQQCSKEKSQRFSCEMANKKANEDWTTAKNKRANEEKAAAAKEEKEKSYFAGKVLLGTQSAVIPTIVWSRSGMSSQAGPNTLVATFSSAMLNKLRINPGEEVRIPLTVATPYGLDVDDVTVLSCDQTGSSLKGSGKLVEDRKQPQS